MTDFSLVGAYRFYDSEWHMVMEWDMTRIASSSARRKSAADVDAVTTRLEELLYPVA